MDIGNYFTRNNSYVMQLDQAELQKELSFSGKLFTQDFIEKTLQLTHFACKFYEYLGRPQKYSEQLERILLMNINLNYSQLKADFIEPLQMIKKYLRNGKQRTVSTN